MFGDDWLSRREALLALGTGASAFAFDSLVHAAGKDKDKDKSKGKDKDKSKGKDKDKGSSDSAASGGGKYGGWGGHATGGAGHATVHVKSAADLQAAVKKGNCTILIDVPSIDVTKDITTTASNITIDGQGCTLHGDRLSARGGGAILKFENGKNFVVKNLRLRNGPDNISFKTCSDILLYHVSTTGSGDDGFSVAYGSTNCTISHCFDAGCTRAVFCKYKNTDKITVAHTIMIKNWIRAPKMTDVANFDVRNCINMDWDQHGANIEGKNCNGNVMGNIYIMHKGATGKKHGSMYIHGAGKVFIKDCVYRDCTNPFKSSTDSPIPAPPIVPAYTTNMSALEQQLMSDTSGAGCMPRDKIDKDYLAATSWKVGHDTPFRLGEIEGGKSKGGKKK